MKITNSFHNTETTVRLSAEELEIRAMYADTVSADRRYCARLREKLCGSPTCTCSGVRGERK